MYIKLIESCIFSANLQQFHGLSAKYIISPFIIVISLFVFSYTIINIIYGLNDSVICRLISTDFSFTRRKITSLFVGYFAGLITYSIALRLIYPSLFGNISVFGDVSVFKNLFVLNSGHDSIVSVLALASSLGLCFTARVITKEYGFLYGKQYLSALKVSSSVVLIIYAINYGVPKIYSYFFLSLQSHNYLNILIYAYSDMYNLIDIILTSSDRNIVLILVGILFSISIGEWIIHKSKAKKRSITAALEKFEPVYESIPTEKKAREKRDEMLKDLEESGNELKSIKLITRTLKGFEQIYEKVESNNDLDFKVIAPDLNSNNKNFIHWDMDRKKDYNKRLRHLMDVSTKKEVKNELPTADNESLNKESLDKLIVKWHKEDFKDLKICIVNDKKLLISIKDGGKGRSSLYTENPYAVKHFVQIFDGFFGTI